MKEPVNGNWRLVSPWRLRNEGDHLLAYQCNTTDLVFKVLSPLEASLVPFLDGSADDEELGRLWRQMHSAWLSEADASLASMLQGLAERDHMVAREGLPSPSFDLPREDLLPDFSAYQTGQKRLARPFAVSLYITNNCCTDCLYCYAERPRLPELTKDQWARIFDDLEANQLYIVDIVGADPLARGDILEIMEDMVARDFVFYISTKCRITPAVAERLARMGVGRGDLPPHLVRPLQVSVDSADPVIAGKLVGRSGYLQRAVDSVTNAVAAGMSPRVKGVLTSLNPDAAEGVVRLFYDLGVRDFQFVQYGLSHYRPREDLFLTLEHKLRLPRTLERLQSQYSDIAITIQDDRTVGDRQPRSPRAWQERSVCSGGRSSLQIKANGEVVLCDQLPHSRPFVVGDILKEGLVGVWNSPRLAAFLYPPREAFAGTVCADCPEYDQCHQGKGYCYRDAFLAYDTIYEAPPDCPRQVRPGRRQI